MLGVDQTLERGLVGVFPQLRQARLRRCDPRALWEGRVVQACRTDVSDAEVGDVSGNLANSVCVLSLRVNPLSIWTNTTRRLRKFRLPITVPFTPWQVMRSPSLMSSISGTPHAKSTNRSGTPHTKGTNRNGKLSLPNSKAFARIFKPANAGHGGEVSPGPLVAAQGHPFNFTTPYGAASSGRAD